MSEHDDALLDDDFASLPDINDEEYDLGFSNDDASISTQESLNEQLSCDLKSSLEDILDLNDVDSFEEFEKNTVVEPEAINTLDITNVKQENIKAEYSSDDNYEVQFNEKVLLSTDESNLPEDSSGSEIRCRNVRQCEQNRQKQTSILTNEIEYQRIQSLERECSSRHFDRSVSNENHSYIQPKNYGPSFYQPYFQDERAHLGFLNNSSFLNEPVDHMNIINEPYPIDRLNILNEPCPIDLLSNQPVFCHNSYTNLGYHLPVQTCLYHQPCQNPPFANQILPMQQSIQMPHGHMPITTNPCQPILIESNRQVMYNQNNIGPNHFDSTYCDPPIHISHDQPQFVLNPMYNQNHSNRQKILVNRHFSSPEARRDNWLCHEFDKTDLFLKKIASKKTKSQNLKNFSRSTINMDPYSYFSDIWQNKNTHESNSLKRSLSPEVFFKGPILKNRKFRSMEDANYQESKRPKICSKKSSSCSNAKKTSNIRKRSARLRNNCKRKPNNGENKRKNIDGNSKTSIGNLKKDADVEIKEEEKMDPEMIEYCKKIEEQKRRREKFLQEKEIRRQQLAMEKVGVKIESFTEP